MDKPCDYLVIGANGLVGSAVTKALDSAQAGRWMGTAFRRSSGSLLTLDVTNKENLKSVLQMVKPKTVVFAANLAGGVEAAQANPDMARKFYYEATKDLGELCLQQKARLIFISTELVFDGKKEVYREDDEPNPVNLYGQWKMESEMWIKKNLKDYLIIRTMSVFGWQPETVTPNAVMKAYFCISKKEKLSVPTFRWMTPTYVHDLAKALVELNMSGATGTYHVAGSTFINRHEWLKQVCEGMAWDASWLNPQNEIPTGAAPYPLKIRLDTQKFRGQFKTPLHSLKESIALLKEDIRQHATASR